MALKRIIRHIPAGVFSAVVLVAILWLTLAPHPLPEEDIPLIPGIDKVAHALMFGGLAFAILFDVVLRRFRWGNTSRELRLGLLLVTFVGVSLFGGAIELIQNYMGLGRGMELADFLADTAGALLAVCVSPYIIRCIFSKTGSSEEKSR